MTLALVTGTRRTKTFLRFLVVSVIKNQNKRTVRSIVQKVAKHPMSQPADL